MLTTTHSHKFTLLNDFYYRYALFYKTYPSVWITSWFDFEMMLLTILIVSNTWIQKSCTIKKQIRYNYIEYNIYIHNLETILLFCSFLNFVEMLLLDIIHFYFNFLTNWTLISILLIFDLVNFILFHKNQCSILTTETWYDICECLLAFLLFCRRMTNYLCIYFSHFFIQLWAEI